MLGIRQRTKFTVDKGYEFVVQVIGISADGTGIDVLIAAKTGKAVGKYHNDRRHPLGLYQSVQFFWQVFIKIPPIEMTEAAAGKAR